MVRCAKIYCASLPGIFDRNAAGRVGSDTPSAILDNSNESFRNNLLEKTWPSVFSYWIFHLRLRSIWTVQLRKSCTSTKRCGNWIGLHDGNIIEKNSYSKETLPRQNFSGVCFSWGIRSFLNPRKIGFSWIFFVVFRRFVLLLYNDNRETG